MKKLPVIRHIRWFYLRYKLNCHVAKFGCICAQESDIQYLKNVFQGVL